MTLASSLGVGLEPTVAAMREQRSGLAALRFRDRRPGHLDRSGGRDGSGRAPGGACRLRLPQQPAGATRRCAATASTRQSSALKERYGASRIGVFVGTSTSGILQTEIAYRHRDEQGRLPAGFHYAGTHNTFSVADFTRRLLGLGGPAVAVSAACASSAKVFGNAARMIEAGLIDAAVVGGVDSLCLTTLYGFNSLELVSSDACRPFDAHRRGISIGEAGGFAILRAARCPERSGCHRCSRASASRATRTTCRRRIRKAQARAPRCEQALRSARRRAAPDRLHQPARHRHAEQRCGRGPRRLRRLRRRGAGKLHQGRNRPHARRGGHPGGDRRGACHPAWPGARRHQHHDAGSRAAHPLPAQQPE